MKTLFKISLVSFFAVFASVAGLSAKTVGSGNVISETRNVSGFHGLVLANSGDVVVTQGDTESLVVEAEDNILPLVETTVTDGVLKLGFKANEEVHYTKRLLFKISVKTLDNLMLAGSGNVDAKALKADKFKVMLAGSGNVNVGDLETDALTVDIAGSGGVKLAGKAAKQAVRVMGSGDYEAGALKTGAATVKVVGSGDCELTASETLDITMSGSGDVSYHGNPTVTKHVSGSGDVTALGGGK